MRNNDYQIYSEEFFKQQAEHSWSLQRQMEKDDVMDFDTFMHKQFGV